MKYTKALATTLILSTAIFATEANTTAANAQMAIKQEGVKYIKMLGKALQGEMKKHMQADKSGLEAVKFCSEKARELGKEINSKLPENVRVRRTSLKIRDPKNKPDETDIKVMQSYLEKMKEGKFNPKDIQVVEVNGTKRVYKPLVVGKACLKCHGSNISPEIAEVIKKNFPEDKAVGFKEGDLRGVVVAEIKQK